jgi:hypothetical protein
MHGTKIQINLIGIANKTLEQITLTTLVVLKNGAHKTKLRN